MNAGLIVSCEGIVTDVQPTDSTRQHVFVKLSVLRERLKADRGTFAYTLPHGYLWVRLATTLPRLPAPGDPVVVTIEFAEASGA